MRRGTDGDTDGDTDGEFDGVIGDTVPGPGDTVPPHVVPLSAKLAGT